MIFEQKLHFCSFCEELAPEVKSHKTEIDNKMRLSTFTRNDTFLDNGKNSQQIPKTVAKAFLSKAGGGPPSPPDFHGSNTPHYRQLRFVTSFYDDNDSRAKQLQLKLLLL